MRRSGSSSEPSAAGTISVGERMTEQAKARLAPGAWVALAIIAATNAMSLLDRQILAILAPAIKKDLNVGDAEMEIGRAHV